MTASILEFRKWVYFQQSSSALRLQTLSSEAIYPWLVIILKISFPILYTLAFLNSEIIHFHAAVNRSIFK